ncbi:ComEA family DNA-binding protein [Congregibacter sp.]|uniref:ComEA family DNA-binding protein n=1 Tax=Congregibacter sp. TaxID=2744308 RepID=UPI0039E42D93
MLALFALGTHFSLQAPVVLAQAESADSVTAVAMAREEIVVTVNLNTASADELASQLVGIGGSKAEAIVRYREQFGPFESVDELSEVTGIGASTVERNRSVLRTQ